MRELKTDLHLHTAEDPYDVITRDAFEVIDRAARHDFEVLAITNHYTRTYSEEIERYAADKGILMIPGIEVSAGLEHILILNPSEEAVAARNFDEIREARRNNGTPMAIIAPHPFLPSPSSPGRSVIDNLDVFDALEYCAYSFRWMNPNRRTRRMSRRLGLPLLASSDAHYSWQFGRTYSMIEAPKTLEGVIGAIRMGRVRVVSEPLPVNGITMRIGLRGMGVPEYLLWKEWREGDPYWDKDK